MNTIDYHNPTHIHIGEESTAAVIADLAKAGYKKAMIHYGSGSVMRNGAYDDTVKALKEHGVDFIESGGQKPNPRYQIARAAMNTYMENGCDCIIAVGGGSVNDSAKFIALGVDLIKTDAEVNVWDAIMEGDVSHGAPKAAEPLFTILTMSATGSESNNGGVITYQEGTTLKKYPFGHPACSPVSAGVAPQYQTTLPTFQMCSGALDVVSHVLESYQGLGQTTGRLPVVQMGMIEGVIAGVRERVPELIANPADLVARTDLIWAAYNGLNYLLHQGSTQDWSTHSLEHAVSAVTDVTHGIGLAVIHVGFWRWMEAHPERLTDGQKLMMERLRQNVFGGAQNMEEVVAQWRAMLAAWNMPTTLQALLEMQAGEQMKEKSLNEWLEIFAENNMQRNFGSFQAHNGGWTKDDLVEVLQLAVRE